VSVNNALLEGTFVEAFTISFGRCTQRRYDLLNDVARAKPVAALKDADELRELFAVFVANSAQGIARSLAMTFVFPIANVLLEQVRNCACR
jgi:hypothetical protein